MEIVNCQHVFSYYETNNILSSLFNHKTSNCDILITLSILVKCVKSPVMDFSDRYSKISEKFKKTLLSVDNLLPKTK